jgi:uncharacterized membrane protein (UPF0127 family)
MLLAIVAFGAVFATGRAQQPEESPATGLPWEWSLGDYREFATITVGTETLQVEIVDNSTLHVVGLSYRDGLEPGTGMLFVYPEESIRTFWMKEMRFCLDIIWLSDTSIVGAAENACPQPGDPDAELLRFESNAPVRFILEVPANWLAERGYGAGTPVDLTGVPGFGD